MMNRKKYLLLAVLFLLSGGAAYTLLQNPAHDFSEQQCPDCHATTPVKGKRETLRMKASIEYLCGRCHSRHIENSLSHPVEMAPVTAIPPADLPLSWDGKMTCSTCHDIHASSDESGTLGRKFLRRKATGAEFCSACHVQDAKLAGKNGHSYGMGIAHMKYSADARGGRIDAVSQMCLSCHDGSLGKSSDVQIKSGSWSHGSSFSPYDPQGSHPIGIRYRSAFTKRGGLRPVGMLDPVIKLIDGKVGCRSCHDPFSKERNHLVMSNSGSRLCLACHDK